jgi:tRNA pseudouridine55 synthase
VTRTKPPSGVLVVDKPIGPTSHDVVARVRRALRTREVGHAGTLDPMASGVLVVAVGEATKLVPYLTGAAKEYRARVALGRETDTLDATGTVTREAPIPSALEVALASNTPGAEPFIEAAILAEAGRALQVPPVYSAIHSGGERAYARARRGESVELAPRAVRVHRLEVVAASAGDAPWIELSVRADKGFYVRSLARDLAHALGTVGTLSELRRVDSGGFRIDEAASLDTLGPSARERLLPLTTAACRALPSATLSPSGVVAARFGQRVARVDLIGECARGEPTAWLDERGRLVAIGRMEETGQVLRGFSETDSAG